MEGRQSLQFQTDVWKLDRDRDCPPLTSWGSTNSMDAVSMTSCILWWNIVYLWDCWNDEYCNPILTILSSSKQNQTQTDAVPVWNHHITSWSQNTMWQMNMYCRCLVSITTVILILLENKMTENNSLSCCCSTIFMQYGKIIYFQNQKHILSVSFFKRTAAQQFTLTHMSQNVNKLWN